MNKAISLFNGFGGIQNIKIIKKRFNDLTIVIYELIFILSNTRELLLNLFSKNTDIRLLFPIYHSQIVNFRSLFTTLLLSCCFPLHTCFQISDFYFQFTHLILYATNLYNIKESLYIMKKLWFISAFITMSLFETGMAYVDFELIEFYNLLMLFFLQDFMRLLRSKKLTTLNEIFKVQISLKKRKSWR